MEETQTCICPGRKFISESDNILHIYTRGAIKKFYVCPCSKPLYWIWVLDFKYLVYKATITKRPWWVSTCVYFSIHQVSLCLLYSQICPLYLVIKEFLQKALFSKKWVWKPCVIRGREKNTVVNHSKRDLDMPNMQNVTQTGGMLS